MPAEKCGVCINVFNSMFSTFHCFITWPALICQKKLFTSQTALHRQHSCEICERFTLFNSVLCSLCSIRFFSFQISFQPITSHTAAAQQNNITEGVQLCRTLDLKKQFAKYLCPTIKQFFSLTVCEHSMAIGHHWSSFHFNPSPHTQLPLSKTTSRRAFSCAALLT